jgi:hypothetical protein
VNEEAKALYKAMKIQPQWVVTPGKQTNNYLNLDPDNTGFVLTLYINLIQLHNTF